MKTYTRGNITFIHIGDFDGKMVGFYSNKATKSIVPAIIDYFENYHIRNNDFTMTIKDRDRRKFIAEDRSDRDVDEWEISFALTGEATMTGGRLKRIERHIDEDTFFVTYGDGVSDVDIGSLYAFHQASGKTATLTGVQPPTTFGIVEADEKNRITSFREKPVLPGRINGGYFVFKREIFDHIEGDSTVLEDVPFKRLVRSGDIMMFNWDGFWHCMDTHKDHLELNKMWKDGKAPWKLWA